MNKEMIDAINQNDATIGFCLKTKEGEVVYQNTACLKLCGSRQGVCCIDNCMDLYKRSDEALTQIGTQYFKGKEIGSTPCDVILVNDGAFLITLIVKLDTKLAEYKDFLEAYNLTPRESEVFDMLLIGKTNQEIAEILFISVPTIRTHFSHIREKVPENYLQGVRENW